jgi:hypothetical protein
MSDQPEPDHSGKGTLTWLIWLLGLIFLYALGVGPAAKVSRAHPRTTAVLDTLYKPLDLVCTKVPPLKEVFDWYIFELWRAGPS